MPRKPPLKFKKFQQEFTKYIRNPKKNPLPHGVSKTRMQIYTNLLFNNIHTVLSSCYPVTKKIVGEIKWKKLVRQFFSDHCAQTPFYRETPKEFLDFLENRPHLITNALASLLNYEWMELKTYTSLAPLNNWKLNSTLLCYPYAVHLMGPKNKKPQITSYYFLYRDKAGEVHSLVLNPLTARLIQLLKKGNKTEEEILKKISKELKITDTQKVITEGKLFLKELKNSLRSQA